LWLSAPSVSSARCGPSAHGGLCRDGYLCAGPGRRGTPPGPPRVVAKPAQAEGGRPAEPSLGGGSGGAGGAGSIGGGAGGAGGALAAAGAVAKVAVAGNMSSIRMARSGSSPFPAELEGTEADVMGARVAVSRAARSERVFAITAAQKARRTGITSADPLTWASRTWPAVEVSPEENQTTRIQRTSDLLSQTDHPCSQSELGYPPRYRSSQRLPAYYLVRIPRPPRVSGWPRSGGAGGGGGGGDVGRLLAI
jgi:hypothetical protein